MHISVHINLESEQLMLALNNHFISFYSKVVPNLVFMEYSIKHFATKSDLKYLYL